LVVDVTNVNIYSIILDIQLLVNALLSKEHASAAKPDEKDCPPDPPHIGMFNMIKGNKPMTWYKIKA